MQKQSLRPRALILLVPRGCGCRWMVHDKVSFGHAPQAFFQCTYLALTAYPAALSQSGPWFALVSSHSRQYSSHTLLTSCPLFQSVPVKTRSEHGQFGVFIIRFDTSIFVSISASLCLRSSGQQHLGPAHSTARHGAMHPPTTAFPAPSHRAQQSTTGSRCDCKCEVPTTAVKIIDIVLKAVGWRSWKHKVVVICECWCHNQVQQKEGT